MKFDICIVGLGYVGLTLATAFANKGMKVLGVEKRADIVEKTNQGVPHFQEDGLAEVLSHRVARGDLVAKTAIGNDDEIDGIFIITVGTPLNDRGEINLDFIRSATSDVLSHLTNGSLVVLRSTVKAGTCRNIVFPLLEATGKEFHLAMCPERTLEGRAMEELGQLPQVIGAESSVAHEKAEALFSILTNAIVRLSSWEAAEVLKLVDNTYRDVQFAFANEVARVCEAYSVNAMEVINGGKLGYERTNVALPGLVGGPCLEKDPHILAASALEKGLMLEITAASRLVNERQPDETVDFIRSEATRRGFKETGRIAVMGIAFKGVPETDDLRGAMSVRVIKSLRRSFPKASICLFDPVIDPAELETGFDGCSASSSIRDVIAGADIAVITNNHPRFKTWAPNQMVEEMADSGFIYDYWNHFPTTAVRGNDRFYFAVGNT